MTNRKIALVLAATSLLAAGCARQRIAQPPPSKTPSTEVGLLVYIPCGMQNTFMKVLEAFQKETGIVSRGYYDNTMILVRKITEKGDRPDIFLSPGGYETHFLEEKGVVEPNSGVPIGSYTILLVVPSGNPARVNSLQDLAKPAVKAIGLGDPEFNSIGHFTRQSLEKLGLWEKVKGKIVATEHPVASFEQVTSGKVQAAFSFNACPLESNPEKLAKQNVDIIQALPEDSYDIPTVTIVTLKDAPHKDAARKFLDFLGKESTQKLLADNGLPNQRNLNLAAAHTRAKEAKVVINAYYPANEEHKKIFDMVRKFQKKYPGQVLVNCYDLRGNNIEDLRAYQKSGLTCAGIQINGKSTWMVRVKGNLTEAAFLKSPWVGGWSEEGLEAAVAQAVTEATAKEETQ